MARIAEPHRRETILDAARQVFLRDGFAAAHMSEIARRAKIAVGTLYLYFDSKDAIARAIAAQAFARAAGVIVPALERPLTRTSIATLVRRTFDAVFEDQAFGLIDVPVSDVAPTYAPTAYSDLASRVAEAFERQMREGTVRRDDPAMMADYFLIVLRRAIVQSAHVGKRDPEPYASTLARFLSSALLPAPAAQPRRKAVMR
jgi:TetR/AcrR family fatty acid metabolism transcriptional regulator